MIKGNKGEWSEIYTLFKLLGDTTLHSGDSDLNKIEELFFQIIRIIRTESEGTFEYAIEGDLVIITGAPVTLRIPISTFANEAIALLAQIKQSSGSFSVPETEDFMDTVHCKTIKASSTNKSDIRIVLHDARINQNTELGFSIKSQLGGDSTLLNAGKTTNFIYKVTGFRGTEKDIDRINSIETRSKIKDRIEAIKLIGGKFEFTDLENPIFKNNLILVDSNLPHIISDLVYHFFTSGYNKISEITELTNATNPLNYDNQHNHSFYSYKIKRFLTDVALGMVPSKVWQGVYDATGGYLIVKENGEILCYHIYNRNQFEDYLYFNTKMETASSTRHEFGKIYTVGNEFYFKLNLQIRFS